MDFSLGAIGATLVQERCQEDREALIRQLSEGERKRRAYWDEIVKNVRQYPDEPEKWKYPLLHFIDSPPRFVKDPDAWARFLVMHPGAPNPAPIDAEAKGRWQKEYESLREGLLKLESFGQADRVRLMTAEINVPLWQMQDAVARGETVDREAVLHRILANSGELNSQIPSLVNTVFLVQHKAGFTYEELWGFVQKLKSSGSGEARRYGRARERMLMLAKEPMRYRARTLEGQTIDLEDLRGKYVLVHIWPYG